MHELARLPSPFRHAMAGWAHAKMMMRAKMYWLLVMAMVPWPRSPRCARPRAVRDSTDELYG